MPEDEVFAYARTSTPSDLSELERLANLARELVEPQRGGRLFLGLEARRETLQVVVEEPDRLCVTGGIDGAVLGYAVASLVPTTYGDAIASISDLFVEPEAREVGVGEELMRFVLSWAEARGCAGVDATALPGDRQTKNFFETFGLVARAIRVHRAIQ